MKLGVRFKNNKCFNTLIKLTESKTIKPINHAIVY